MRNIIRLLTYSSLATILLFAGCSTGIYDNNLSDCPKELPVSIVASIKSEYNFQDKPSAASPRTAGVVVDDGYGHKSWKEKAVEIEAKERDIAHIFLFAYRRGETTPEKVILYYPSGKKPTGIDSAIEQRELTYRAGGTDILSMNLELFSGFYNFVLIVNSEAALEAAKSGIPDPGALTEENQVLTSDNLNGLDRKYLPMVGQSELFVPKHNSGSESNRITLNPTIDLERVHARVEFILTTQKSAAEGGGYISSILPNSEVKSLKLLNEQKIYTVMPSSADYTVTGKGQTSSDHVIRAPKLTVSTPMDVRPSFHKGTEKPGSDHTLAKFIGRRLPYDITHKVSKYIYVAPNTLATSIDQCLALDLEVAFPHQTSSGEYTHYKIPLYNVDIKDTNDSKRYITRRNTIYRIGAKLHGPDLIELDYNVVDWTNQDVDIPW